MKPSQPIKKASLFRIATAWRPHRGRSHWCGVGRGIASRFFLMATGWLLSLAGVATAASFHVDLAGSNVTGDGSQAHPWLSIPFAVTSVPNGTAGNPTVIHPGPGEFAETSDGSQGQLLIANRQFVQIKGAGPFIEPGLNGSARRSRLVI